MGQMVSKPSQGRSFHHEVVVLLVQPRGGIGGTPWACTSSKGTGSQAGLKYLIECLRESCRRGWVSAKCRDARQAVARPGGHCIR
jgi:hypothetical protein